MVRVSIESLQDFCPMASEAEIRKLCSFYLVEHVPFRVF